MGKPRPLDRCYGCRVEVLSRGLEVVFCTDCNERWIAAGSPQDAAVVDKLFGRVASF